jgi:DNA-binding PadR family transcriptional regulator
MALLRDYSYLEQYASHVPAKLSTTSFALLGLLVFDRASAEGGMTGYELKQRADRTLRFYWVSPAMSQIYTELDRLHRHGYVDATEVEDGKRTTKRFAITSAGRKALEEWLRTPASEFPVLKHPIALRLMLGSLMGPGEVRAMLDDYLEQLAARRGELEAVREMLGDLHEVRFPARVADWGLAYYDSEAEIVERLRKDVD